MMFFFILAQSIELISARTFFHLFISGLELPNPKHFKKEVDTDREKENKDPAVQEKPARKISAIVCEFSGFHQSKECGDGTDLKRQVLGTVFLIEEHIENKFKTARWID
jgi:hypothetical protein